MVKSLGASSSFRAIQDRVRQIDSVIRVTDLESLGALIQQKRDWLTKQRVVVTEQVRKEEGSATFTVGEREGEPVRIVVPQRR